MHISGSFCAFINLKFLARLIVGTKFSMFTSSFSLSSIPSVWMFFLLSIICYRLSIFGLAFFAGWSLFSMLFANEYCGEDMVRSTVYMRSIRPRWWWTRNVLLVVSRNCWTSNYLKQPICIQWRRYEDGRESTTHEKFLEVSFLLSFPVLSTCKTRTILIPFLF